MIKCNHFCSKIFYRKNLLEEKKNILKMLVIANAAFYCNDSSFSQKVSI